MRIRAWKSGEKVKPVRVFLEKSGKRVAGPISYPVSWLPPKTGERWDEKHLVSSVRIGSGDDTWDELIVVITEG